MTFILFYLFSFGLGTALLFKSNEFLTRFWYLSIVLFTIIISSTHFNETIVYNYFVIISAFLLLLHFLISELKVFKKTIPSLIVIFLSFASFYLIQFDTVLYNQSPTFWLGIFLIIIPIISALAHPLAEYLACYIKSWLGLPNSNSISLGLELGFLAVVLFVADLFMPQVGWLLILLAYTCQYFYRINKKPVLLVFLLCLCLFHHFSIIGDIKTINILFTKNIFGIVLGAVFVAISAAYPLVTKFKLLYVLMTFGIVIFFSCTALWLGTQKTDLGGIETFLSIILGFSIASAFVASKLKNVLFTILIIIGLIGIPKITNQFKSIKSKIELPFVENTDLNEKPNILNTPALSTDSLKTKFNIVSDSSVLTFILGPDGGKTQGIIKDISGTVDFTNHLMPVFKIDFEAKSLTTFVNMRDESLRADGYLNVKKYPKFNFVSKTVTKVAEIYKVSGEFTMLGKTNNEVFEMKYIGKSKDGKRHIIVGKSQIDRTKYGMKSNPMEGDIVEYEFKLELE